MPEKQKRKLSDPSSQSGAEVSSLSIGETLRHSEQDFEDIFNRIQNKVSKRLRDAEFGQWDISRLIEKLSSKVNNLSSTSSEQGCSTIRIQHNENTVEELQETRSTSNVNSNIIDGL